MSFEFGFKGEQYAKAIAFEFVDPEFLYLKERNGVEVVELLPPLPDDGDQIGGFELLQVLGDGLAGHVHVLAQCRERLAVVGVQLVQQAPSPGVSQCLEYFVDVQVVFRCCRAGG